MKTIRAALGLPVLLLLLVGAGCGGDDSTGSDSSNITETSDIFGNDRVADKLKGHLDKVPGTYQEFEKVFSVGRECSRTDSKEIFVVEESQTRAGGHSADTKTLLPRAVITGCNTDTSNADSAINSFSLMAALFSPANGEKGNPMQFSPVEVIALDRTTGLYNFYVFESNGKGKPGTLNRVRRMPDDSVVKYRIEPKGKMQTLDVPDRACNNCHANMGPLMNELTEPWTNWVSTHKELPAEKLTGETLSVVNEAVPGSDGRSSFANDLEPIMRAAIRVWIEGDPKVAGSGFGQAAIDGDQPQRLEGLMKSVFCETELQFVSAAELEPFELFIDPAAVAGKGFLAPSSIPQDRFPIQMPVRSEMDKRIERFLLKKKYLSLSTVLAVRLVDDEHDIFSKDRCDLLAPVVDGLPAKYSDPTEVDAAVRKVLSTKATATVPAGARADYIKALLSGVKDVSAAQAAYLEDAKKRFDASAALLKNQAGRTQLKARDHARKVNAEKMFSGDASPLPILDIDE